MNEPLALFGAFGSVLVLVLLFVIFAAAVFLPLFVWGIYNRTRETAETLARLEKRLASDSIKFEAIAKTIEKNAYAIASRVTQKP